MKTDKIRRPPVILNNNILMELKVFPNSSKNEITGFRDNRLCVKIAAPAENGKANACLCEFIAKSAGCAKREVAVVKGEKSKLKTVSMPGIFYKNLTQKLIESGFTKPENV